MKKHISLNARATLAWLFATVAALMNGGAVAAPTGGNIIAGSASFNHLGGGATIIGVDQTSDSAIIEWQTFNLGDGENFIFDQPSSNAVTLNRVLGPGVSTIDGIISANGNVFIINGDGILFSANAVLDVNGLLATTTDIENADFMAGVFNFQFPGAPDASIINRGDISAADAGIIAFVAPNVANEGVIAARLGKVTLGAGEKFTLDFFGDGLVAFASGGAVGDSTGQIDVSGQIDVDGGAIYLTATTARQFIETVINVEADLVARSAKREGGKIILSGSDNSTIMVDATLDASGADGGEISITGGIITIAAGAQLLANGIEPVPANVIWTFQNSGFGGADTGTALTGLFTFDADTGLFSDIMVVSGPGATLPGANYIALGPQGGANQIDFVSSTAADISGAHRLLIGFNGPLTNAGGTLGNPLKFADDEVWHEKRIVKDSRPDHVSDPAVDHNTRIEYERLEPLDLFGKLDIRNDKAEVVLRLNQETDAGVAEDHRQDHLHPGSRRRMGGQKGAQRQLQDIGQEEAHHKAEVDGRKRLQPHGLRENVGDNNQDRQGQDADECQPRVERLTRNVAGTDQPDGKSSCHHQEDGTQDY